MSDSTSSIGTRVIIFGIFSEMKNEDTSLNKMMLTRECVHGIHLTPVGIAVVIIGQMSAKSPSLG